GRPRLYHRFRSALIPGDCHREIMCGYRAQMHAQQTPAILAARMFIAHYLEIVAWPLRLQKYNLAVRLLAPNAERLLHAALALDLVRHRVPLPPIVVFRVVLTDVVGQDNVWVGSFLHKDGRTIGLNRRLIRRNGTVRIGATGIPSHVIGELARTTSGEIAQNRTIVSRGIWIIRHGHTTLVDDDDVVLEVGPMQWALIRINVRVRCKLFAERREHEAVHVVV